MEKTEIQAVSIRVKPGEEIVGVRRSAVSGSPNRQSRPELKWAEAILLKYVDILTPLCSRIDAAGCEPVVVARGEQHPLRAQAGEAGYKEIGGVRGGIAPDGDRWVRCRRDFFLPVRVLSRLFRRLFLEGLQTLHDAGELQFFTNLASLKDASAFRTYLGPLRKSEWVVFAKRPFAGPGQVLAYLARYTHRVAIGNSRLVDLDDHHVSFRWKDYRENGASQSKAMRLAVGEFMRRFLLHVLPDGFHRIRHYGLFANGHRADKLALCRRLLQAPATATAHDNDNLDEEAAPSNDTPPCPCCGGRMNIIENFDGPYSRPFHARRADSS